MWLRASTRHRRRAGHGWRERAPRGERALLAAVSLVVFVDTMLYAVLTPLLPGLSHSLQMSKLAAGVMAAAYAAGTLAGSIPGGVLAVRLGPRVTVCTGLTLLIASILAFGLVHQVLALDLARFVEGVGGACSWAGGLAWIVADAPPERRGALIGQALAAAIGGSLLGPVIGTVASATGRPAAFTVLAGLVGLLLVVSARRPSTHRPSAQGTRALVTALGRREMRSAMWLVALPALGSGLINVLGPLRLHHLGVAAGGIGATFLIAAVCETGLAPLVGGLSDRRGRMLPLRVGLLAAAVTLPGAALPRSALPFAATIVLSVGAMGIFWAPAMALMADVASSAQLEQGLAAALMNLAWAGGQIAGSGGAGAIAKATGDGVPFLIAAALCAATLAGLRRTPVGSDAG